MLEESSQVNQVLRFDVDRNLKCIGGNVNQMKYRI